MALASFSAGKTTNASYWPLVSGVPAWRLSSGSPSVWNDLMDALAIWPQNVSAGGFNLSNVGTLSCATLTAPAVNGVNILTFLTGGVVLGADCDYTGFGSLIAAAGPGDGTGNYQVRLGFSLTHGYGWISSVASAGVQPLILCATKVGINTGSPTSVLHVAGLPTYASDGAAGTAGLTAGAFYKDSSGGLHVKL
jgi:hypothetical protein